MSKYQLEICYTLSIVGMFPLWEILINMGGRNHFSHATLLLAVSPH